MEQNVQEEEFRRVFEEYADELFGYCASRLSDRERAMELTQECFLRAWKYLCRGMVITHYRSFLYRTLHNLIIDEYRRGMTESLEHIIEKRPERVEELLRDTLDPMHDAMQRSDAQDAVNILSILPHHYSNILRLRYLQGLSPAEAGLALNESANTVSVRTHRALKKLRDAFEKLESIGAAS